LPTTSRRRSTSSFHRQASTYRPIASGPAQTAIACRAGPRSSRRPKKAGAASSTRCAAAPPPTDVASGFPPDVRATIDAVSRALLILCLIASAACSRATPAASTTSHLVERTHQTMGTEIKITAWTSDDARADVAMSAVFGDFDRLDDLMSVWKDTSDIAR